MVEEIGYGALDIFIFRRMSCIPAKALHCGTLHFVAKLIFQNICVKCQLV